MGDVADFARIAYFVLTGVIVLLLITAGLWSRLGPYTLWRDGILRQLILQDIRDIATTSSPNPSEHVVHLPDTSIPTWLRVIGFFRTSLWCLCEMTTHAATYIPLLLFGILIIVGPSLIGELMTGKYGVVFAWGIFVEGEVIHSADTVLFSLPRVMLGYIPLVIISSLQSFLIHRRQLHRDYPNCTCQHVNAGLWPVRVVSVIVLLWQLWVVVEIGVAYGVLAIISPGSGILLLLEFWIFYRSYRVAK